MPRVTTDGPMQPDVPDQIYILPASLLDTHRALVSEFRTLSGQVGVAPGWHYPLDLAWAAHVLTTLGVERGRVLDAGAGIGLMQWWLAARGAEVLSVDRDPRHFSRRMREVTTIRGVARSVALRSTIRMAHHPQRRRAPLDEVGLAIEKGMRDLVLGDPPTSGVGTVIATQSDLRDLSSGRVGLGRCRRVHLVARTQHPR